MKACSICCPFLLRAPWVNLKLIANFQIVSLQHYRHISFESQFVAELLAFFFALEFWLAEIHTEERF